MEMTSFAPKKFFGQIGVDQRSKNLDSDCIMKAFFVERNHVTPCKEGDLKDNMMTFTQVENRLQ